MSKNRHFTSFCAIGEITLKFHTVAHKDNVLKLRARLTSNKVGLLTKGINSDMLEATLFVGSMMRF